MRSQVQDQLIRRSTYPELNKQIDVHINPGCRLES